MNKNDKTFKNKVVLITGASSGIGEAMARAFAAEGASLGLLARRYDRLENLVSDCQKKGGKALAIASDVTKDEDLPKAVEEIHNKLGTIDIVIANAGFGVSGFVENLNLADFQRQFETNVYGVLRTIYATLDDLKKSKGRLVIIGSGVGHISVPKASPYTMSKFAVRTLSECLYAELAPYGISVTLISPGLVKSEFRQVNNLGQYQGEDAREPIPQWLRLNTDKAANIILTAVRNRKRERIITFNAKLGVFINRLFPGLLHWYFKRQAMRKFKKKS